MTAQVKEILLYAGEEYGMATEPLNTYFRSLNKLPKFISPSTACWRGYYGSWEIRDNKLMLTSLKAYIEGYKEVNLNYLFPDQTEVFANWFTGIIKIPHGEMIEYVHSGYESKFEKERYLIIEEGNLVDNYLFENKYNN